MNYIYSDTAAAVFTLNTFKHVCFLMKLTYKNQTRKIKNKQSCTLFLFVHIKRKLHHICTNNFTITGMFQWIPSFNLNHLQINGIFVNDECKYLSSTADIQWDVHINHLSQRWHDQPVACHWAVRTSAPHEDLDHWISQLPTLWDAPWEKHAPNQGQNWRKCDSKVLTHGNEYISINILEINTIYKSSAIKK